MVSSDGSTDRDTPPRPRLNSMVVRVATSDSDSEDGSSSGGGGGDGRRRGFSEEVDSGDGRRRGSSEEVDVRRKEEKPLHASGSFRSRPGRYRYGRHNHQGNGERSGSVSPLHQRRADHDSDGAYSNRSPPRHGRDLERGRGRRKSRGLSPPYRGRQPLKRRDIGRQEIEAGYVRGNGIPGNSRNVTPRKGDWLCSDPMCGNLNFAGRSFCYNCKKGRYEREVARPMISSHQGYPGHRLHKPPSFLPLSPVERPSRMYGGPPPRGLRRDGSREYPAPISPRRGDRFSDRRFEMDEGNYLEAYRGVREFDRSPPPNWIREFDRSPPPNWIREFDRSPPPNWIPRNNGRGGFLSRRREPNDGNNVGLLPYPLLPYRAPLLNNARERSSSPRRRGGLKKRRMDSHSRGYPQIAERRMMVTNY